MSETETWTCDLCGLEMKDNKGGIQKHKGSLKCQQRQQKSSNDNGGSIHRGSITNYFKPKQNSNTDTSSNSNNSVDKNDSNTTHNNIPSNPNDMHDSTDDDFDIIDNTAAIISVKETQGRISRDWFHTQQRRRYPKQNRKQARSIL
eukprot:467840_1